MGTPGEGTDRAARLVELQIADDPAGWTDLGFTVADGVVQIDPIALRLTGSAGAGTRGITGWTVAGLVVPDGDLDGLPTRLVDDEDAAGSDRSSTSTPADPPVPHPNGVSGLDHVVVLTPDLDRTIAVLEAAGLDLRRIRDTTGNGAPMRQAFFKLGPVVLEVVSGDVGTGQPAADAPATFWGLAVDVEDLDRTAEVLGDRLGRVKVAVQRGRRIATLRTREVDVSVAIAAMDRHADRAPAHDGDR